VFRAFGLYTHIRNNLIKSALLLAGFPFVLPSSFFSLVFLGLTLFGHQDAFPIAINGSYIVLILVVAITVVWLPIAYFMHHSIVDAATGARQITRAEVPRVWNLLENLCISRGMTMPALRIIETEACIAMETTVLL
jgi:heat shock protein HtpX